MKVLVRLYGTYRQRVAGYRHAEGLEIELGQGATVADLLALLDVSEQYGAAVLCGNRALEPGDEIRPGALLAVMQMIGSG